MTLENIGNILIALSAVLVIGHYIINYLIEVIKRHDTGEIIKTLAFMFFIAGLICLMVSDISEVTCGRVAK